MDLARKIAKQITGSVSLLLVLLYPVVVGANGLHLSNLSIRDSNAAGYATIEFDVTWQNSWRTVSGPANWDAAWVFFKFRVGSGPWKHALLNNTGHTAPSGSVVSVGLVDESSAFNASSNPGVGVFIHRASTGSGTFTATDVGVRWNFGESGVTTSDQVDVKVGAVEMVYVPQGSFWVGDSTPRTGGSNSHFFDASSSAGAAVQIGSTAPYISNVSDGSGTAGDIAWVNESGGAGTLPASRTQLSSSFPRGYQSLYVMKGEISQKQWVEFFNGLTDTQKSTRDITSATGKNSDAIVVRNNVSWSGGSAAAALNGDTHGAVATNYLSWADLTAYLDWSGLRPMSELEYEKIARGDQTPVANEYAWGNTMVTQTTGIGNVGLPNELATPGNATCVYGSHASVQGPVRVGNFAKSGSTRATAGAGYYGALDLSGNIWERTVAIGNIEGQNFTGLHGNGELDASGNPNVSTWPGTNSQGTGFRGGAWVFGASYARVADRFYAGTSGGGRTHNIGGRGVRTAPSTP